MTLYDWVAIVLSVVMVGAALSGAMPFFQGLAVRRIAWLAGIGVPPVLEPTLRHRAAVLGASANLGAFAVFAPTYGILRAHADTVSPVEFWTCLAAAALGQSFGEAISSLVIQLRPLDSSSVRLARTRVVTVHDYVAVPLHVVAWVIWVVAVAIVALSVRGNPEAAPGLAIVIMSGIGLVLFEVGSRAILRRGQPAGSTDELIWDDALRSSTLRSQLVTTALPVVFGGFVAVQTRLDHNDLGGWVIAGLVVMFIAYAVFVWGVRNTRRWYLERLWPKARSRTASERAERDAEQLAASR